MSDERERFLRRLGESLARAMKAQGVSAASLAEATRLPESRIESIVRAEVEAIAFEVPLLAEGLGVRPEDLVEGWDG
ncbi:MAG: helix-turn-helix domain-containing protein [Solirubrobacterales bacterium]